jgi:hypothetical protein
MKPLLLLAALTATRLSAGACSQRCEGIPVFHNRRGRAIKRQQQVFAEIRADGGIHIVDKRIVSVAEIFELQRVAEMKTIEKKYLR